MTDQTGDTTQRLHGPQGDGKYGLLSAPGVARPRKKYAAPKPAGLFWRRKESLSIVRKDGGRFMVLVTTNSYKDREGETITTKALANYVKSAYKGEKYIATQPLYYWHDDKLPAIGDVVWADMEGPFLIEVAQERPTAFARKMWDYIEKHPELKWGASHGFEYPDEALDDDGTYHAVKKFETSVLPLKAAANPYTLSAVVGSKGNMDKDNLLDKMLGTPGAAAKLRKGVQATKAALDKRGVQHKAQAPKVATKGIAEDIQGKLGALMAEISDDPEIGKALLLSFLNVGEEMAEAEAIEEPMDTEEMAMDDEVMDEAAVDEMVDDSEEEKELAEVARPIVKPQSPPLKSLKPAAKAAAPEPSISVKEFKALKQQIADLSEAMRDVVGAIGELADIPERLTAIEAQKSLLPRRASIDPTTVETDKGQLDKVKNLSAEYDTFWGAKVRSEA